MGTFILIIKSGNFGEPFGTGGRNSGVTSGDRLYLFRQGRGEPRGLVAAGHATGEIFQDEHWGDPTRQSNYVPVDWVEVDFPDVRIPIGDLEREIPEVQWKYLQGCTKVPDQAEQPLDELWDSLGSSKA